MLVLVWLFSLVMMMRKRSYAASAEKITARSGDAVLLSSDLQGTDLEAGQDFRWTHPKVMVSLKNKAMICHHKRCELLGNGSLRFSRVLPEDSGNYSLQVFSKTGDRLLNKVFLLTVEGGSSTSSTSSSSVLVPVLICCFLLLLFFIVFFILMRRRRSQMTKTTTDQPAENVYVVMQGNRGNETKDAEKQEKEEESHYVVCNPAVSKETPITQQMSVDAEDIYV